MSDTFRELCESLWGSSSEFDVLLRAIAKKNTDGDAPRWQTAVDQLGQAAGFMAASTAMGADAVRVGEAGQLDETQKAAAMKALKALHPWRKGPYEFFGVHIDTEWRSDWKWGRIIEAIGNKGDLSGQRILDVGCGNGYHLWRMRAAGADAVIGVDPMPLFYKQFSVFAQHMQDPRVALGLCTLEQWPTHMKDFDTVFSMGVFYHRRSAFEHIYQLRSLIRSGGQLVLETLVIDGGEQDVLLPADRYAKMRNVWLIPSIAFMLRGLERCGLKQVRCVDATLTTCDEQRKTAWMEWESLSDFLDPKDPSKTIEGHPAPKRACFIAEVP